MSLKSFASDNASGVHPRILAAMERANAGYARPYGQDPYTGQAKEVFARHFGPDIDMYFVFLGTAANVLGLRAVTRPWHSVVCADVAHINVDECGAPESVTGSKLQAVPSYDGRIRSTDIEPLLHMIGDFHHSQPRVVSITQSTELGTVYSPAQVRALADFAHANGMLLHMDGARLANAAAALDVSLAELTRDAGVDVLSFGGTKNGMMFGEAVIFFNPELSREFNFIRKQGMQLISKMRFIAAQFIEMLHDGLWLENARNANAMARLLADSLRGLPHVAITRPVEANAVFARLSPEHIARLQQDFYFYEWDPVLHEVRWMTSFDTTEADVREFIDAVKALG
ncbi:threonine aldolase family protein [Nitratidesulfovibrio sp. D1]|uniref:threonine aldolase family protein n=1 Tax=Nitratidesulfovibrio sp. D1 TaxID=3440151 RepID=UPI003EBF4FB4